MLIKLPENIIIAWLRTEQGKITFFNDFRWSSQLIPRNDLFFLMRGKNVHLAAPKTFFVKETLLSATT